MTKSTGILSKKTIQIFRSVTFAIVGFLAALITVFEFFTPEALPVFAEVSVTACQNDTSQSQRFLKFIDELSAHDGSTVYIEQLSIYESMRCPNYSDDMLYFDDRSFLNASVFDTSIHQFSRSKFDWRGMSATLKLPDFGEISEYGSTWGGENSYELAGPVSVQVSEIETERVLTLSLGNVSGGAFERYLCTKKVSESGYLIGKLRCIFKI